MDWAGFSISIAYRGCGTRLSTRRAKETAFAAFPTLQSDLLQLLDVSHQHPFLTQRQKISSSVSTNVHARALCDQLGLQKSPKVTIGWRAGGDLLPRNPAAEWMQRTRGANGI
jgi:hypothetical protein